MLALRELLDALPSWPPAVVESPRALPLSHWRRGPMSAEGAASRGRQMRPARLLHPPPDPVLGSWTSSLARTRFRTASQQLSRSSHGNSSQALPRRSNVWRD